MKQQAKEYLQQALDNPNADFRAGQWESIEQLLNKKRVLVVQHTGWGKSMVYFLAAKLLREQGEGPTLLISPLLSLMRNQLEAAAKIGLVTRTINSTNPNEWIQIEKELAANEVDILLISPERLANEKFVQNTLAKMSNDIGLFVVDEAHCISDWGHDFRPDYRRIGRIIEALPSNVPVLATTATANNRVVEDVEQQLGENIIVQRGSLVRKSLKLQNINIPDQATRMAWLAKTIPTLTGSGIVYALTKHDAEQVAKWLVENNIKAEAYHSDIPNREDGSSVKEDLEQQLLNNEIKVLVATVALGMGFDKPDLGFVIHYQRPASVVHYYQQVGRAGRAVDEARGVLLCGKEDEHISDYFIKNAFPPQQDITKILTALDEADSGLSVPEMQSILNLTEGQLRKTLKFLTIESPSPITKIALNKGAAKWQVTVAAASYQVNQEHIDNISNIRREEQRQMRDYMECSTCLMKFLQDALDDTSPTDCGQCKNCKPELLLDETIDEELNKQAKLFLCQSHHKIKPRKQWAKTNMFDCYRFDSFTIPQSLRPREGRVLSLWRDAGWGAMVADGKDTSGIFSDKLVAACVEMLKRWKPKPAPDWVSCIPSLNHPELVPDFAQRLAHALNLPFIPCIEKHCANPPQKEMKNSYQQAKNLDGAFYINEQCREGTCLLIDDMVDSRWTFTVAAALLQQSDCFAVLPMALALNSPKMD
ncbi:MAG: RecQ family ATP-dependent DNA helicase [Proteobacteria bacterium]|nr:RecQ family ATP-dependent DNA helicase [Pseudomonadota bacterium]